MLSILIEKESILVRNQCVISRANLRLEGRTVKLQFLRWAGNMKQIPDFEAQEQFDELLDEVERGETVVITRQGKPVAWLVPEQEVTGNALPGGCR
jgi:prevent-host-death family protein